MARQAVIVGGTGQIGRACARHLAQHGWGVVALSRGQREVPTSSTRTGSNIG